MPAGTSQLELRLSDRVGQPLMTLNGGLRLPGISIYDYGADDGDVDLYDSGTGLISIANPAPGDYSLMVYAGSDFSSSYDEDADPASATLLVRQKPHVPLNFDAARNGGGGSHTDSRQVVDGERTVYEVAIPADWQGLPLPGWMLNLEVTQGSASMRVFKNWPSTLNTEMVTVSPRWGVIVPPWLTPGTTWHVEVLATGSTTYSLSSQVVAAERAPWVMPVGYNQTFGDTGLTPGGSPLPGDQGTDLGEGDWHFYAVEVPSGNGGLLRTELQAISGDPDLYIREDGVPTSTHYTNGNTGNYLSHRSLTSSGTEYGNWVPLDGRSEHELRTGRWYLGVKAAGSSNVRYRLKLSTGSVTDLSLSQPTVANQTMAAGDWRMFRFTVPEDAPLNWNLTFSQQIGDVVMYVRDTVPPGNSDSISSSYIRAASSDSKNQGPYASYGYDAAGTYGFPLPPLRPGHTYYAGFRAVSDAVFSVSSATSGGTLGTLPDLDYYTGTINTSVPAGGSVLYRIPVPPEATRMKWTATHPTSVQMRLEQGTLPGTTGSQHWTSGSSANVTFNQSFTNSNWPWLVSRNYYLRVQNNSGSDHNVVLTMNGKNAATEDEDVDGLPDAWERQYFGSTTHNGTSDPDGDGVTNAVELADGTLPNDVNSAKYFLTFSPYNGTAAKAPDQPKYDRGTTVTLTNTPTGGHTFLGWLRVGSYADDFVMRITGSVTIPADGTYTFGTNAADGLRLKINDVTVITDNTTHSVSDRFGQITLTAGSYPLVLEAFESSSGEGLELFAAPGSHASFNSNFKLLGDTGNGGMVIQTTSSVATVPGLTAKQIIGVGTGNIYNLTRMDELLTGTRAKRAETTLIAQTINFIGSGSSEGRFTGNANFPLLQPEATNPNVIGMFGDYTIAAMNSLPLADAVDAPELTFTQAGEAPWLGSLSALAHDTVDHAVSGPITHSQSSSFSTTVVGPGTLTFRWKVSSQATSDPLQFLVNGSVNQQISGEQAYALVTYAVPSGARTLTWRYTKNGTVTTGEDRGWVDQILFSPVRYSLTVNASAGTVNVSPQLADYAAGTVVTLTALPAGDNSFLGWSGAATGSTNPTTVTMDANKTVTASFGLGLPAALDTLGRTYTLGGNGNWSGQTSTTHDTVDAAQSGAIGHNQETWFETSVTGPGDLSFWWKVSSESGFDYLEFYIDGVLQSGRISGTQDWLQKNHTLAAGSHTLRWRYMKDGSAVSGSDAGWVDEVVWTPSAGFASWQSTHFNPAQLADPLISGPTATPHNDGVSNLLKFAFNMNGGGPDVQTMPPGGSSGLPGITTQPNGANSIFRFEFVRRIGSGLIYTPQKSPDITNPALWNNLTDAPTVIPIDAFWERVVYEEPYDNATTPKCFGRVQVTLPP
ncbi:MAG: hypothetical protein IPK22_19150 [Verrucomicrobiaceae bacterium]|nr:hypothetical protein [Verrucomicrobiaceae bacterium]